MTSRPPQLPDDALAIERRLVAGRPVPSPTFRGQLGRWVTTRYAQVRSQRRWAYVWAVVAVLSGGVAGLGLADVGPLAPGP